MKTEELKQKVLELAADEKIQLMMDLCDSIMSQPGGRENIMPICSLMMEKNPEMMKKMVKEQ